MSQKIESTSVELEHGRPQRSESPHDQLRQSRPSYSPDNAEDFRPIFDKMQRTREAQEIFSQKVGLKASTLYLKANDAFKWLAENDRNKEQYAILRQSICISRRAHSILLYFKPNFSNLVVKAVEAVNGLEGRTWKDDLQDWIALAQSGQLWDTQLVYPNVDLKFSVDDQAWLAKTLSSLDGVEIDFTEKRIRIMR